MLPVNAEKLIALWPNLQPKGLRSILIATITNIEIQQGQLEINVNPKGLRKVLQTQVEHLHELPPADSSNPPMKLRFAVKLKGCGIEMKLVVAGKSGRTLDCPNPVLISTIVKANSWWTKLTCGEATSIRDLVTQVGTNERYVAWVLRLKHLPPDMIEAILDGRQPKEWTADTFIEARKFSHDWNGQRRLFGFASRC